MGNIDKNRNEGYFSEWVFKQAVILVVLMGAVSTRLGRGGNVAPCFHGLDYEPDS